MYFPLREYLHSKRAPTAYCFNEDMVMCVCEGVVYTQGCSQEFCGGRLGEGQRGQLMVCPVCGKTGFEVFTTMTSQTKFDKRV